jgi:hypothetical protein
MRIKFVALWGVLLAWGAICAAPAAANILINGDFETVVMNNGNPLHSTRIGDGVTFIPDSNGVNKLLPTATGWVSQGYNFVFMDNPGYFRGAETPTGADDMYDGAYTNNNAPNPGDRFWLWGPDVEVNRTYNGITNSPTGGNFLGSDGAFLNGPISQTLNNLTIGQQYHLGFWWAAGQQSIGDTLFAGATTDAWTVCFGTCSFTSAFDTNGDGYSTLTPGTGEMYTTATVNIPSHGFSPWRYENFSFTATSTTATLSLLSYGTPLGQPPFALLDGVTLDVPEPTTWAMMLIGFGLVGGIMRTRKPSQNGRRALDAQIL